MILRQAKDEESQIQALARTQDPLPMKPGQPTTRTHDDERHGTTTWFAALDVLEGKVIGHCMLRAAVAIHAQRYDAVDFTFPT